MPFTASHAAAILPFARTPVPPAALVVGSMAPDLPYFLPVGIPRSWTHSVSGAVTIDLLISAVAFAAWVIVLRAPAVDALPRAIRVRMSARPRWRVGRGRGGRAATAGLVLAAFLIGVATHLAWDSFTHSGGLSDVWPVLQTRFVFPVYDLLHAASSLVGAVILLLWVRRWMARTPAGTHEDVLTPVLRTAGWVAMIATGVGVAGMICAPAVLSDTAPITSHILNLAAAVSIGATGLLACAMCIAWWLARLARIQRGASSPVADASRASDASRTGE